MAVVPVLVLFGYLMGGRSVAVTSTWSGFGYSIAAFGALVTGIFMTYAAFASGEKPSSSRVATINVYGVVAKLNLSTFIALGIFSATEDHMVRFISIIIALVIISPANDMLHDWRGVTMTVLPFVLLVFAVVLVIFDVTMEETGLLIGWIVASWAAAILGALMHRRVGLKVREWSLKIAGGLGALLTGMVIPAGSFDDWPEAVVLGVIVSAVHMIVARLSGEKSFDALTGHRNGVWSLVVGACFELIIPGLALIVLIAVVTSNVLRVVLAFLHRRHLRRRSAREEAARKRDDESTTEVTDVPPAAAAN